MNVTIVAPGGGLAPEGVGSAFLVERCYLEKSELILMEAGHNTYPLVIEALRKMGKVITDLTAIVTTHDNLGYVGCLEKIRDTWLRQTDYGEILKVSTARNTIAYGKWKGDHGWFRSFYSSVPGVECFYVPHTSMQKGYAVFEKKRGRVRKLVYPGNVGSLCLPRSLSVNGGLATSINGANLLLLGAMARNNPKYLNFPQAINLAKRVGAQKTGLVYIGDRYMEVASKAITPYDPRQFFIAKKGMVITI